jgi:hypothetical protein
VGIALRVWPYDPLTLDFCHLLDFAWWGLVANAAQTEGAAPTALGSMFVLNFKDGTQW